MGSLDGKVAVITGAASGNGRGMAVLFAADGADIVIADVDRDGMEETARLVREHGRHALTRHCDVASTDAIDQLIAAAVSEFEHVDIAVANAGVAETDTDCLRIRRRHSRAQRRGC